MRLLECTEVCVPAYRLGFFVLGNHVKQMRLSSEHRELSIRFHTYELGNSLVDMDGRQV